MRGMAVGQTNKREGKAIRKKGGKERYEMDKERNYFSYHL
jgi:hypothetical protein